MLMGTPAVASEVLHCKDTDVTGFVWGASGPKRTSFDPIQFSVTAISPSQRLIKFAVYPVAIAYECFSPPGDSVALLCTSTLAKAVEPVIFRGDMFERVINYSKYVRGQSIGLAVAYGTCIKSQNTVR
jgi:hypothetical protein